MDVRSIQPLPPMQPILPALKVPKACPRSLPRIFPQPWKKLVLQIDNTQCAELPCSFFGCFWWIFYLRILLLNSERLWLRRIPYLVKSENDLPTTIHSISVLGSVFLGHPQCIPPKQRYHRIYDTPFTPVFSSRAAEGAHGKKQPWDFLIYKPNYQTWMANQYNFTTHPKTISKRIQPRLALSKFHSETGPDGMSHWNQPLYESA